MEENKEYCPICPKECSVDTPSCGHGRKYVEALNKGEITEEDKERYRLRKEERIKNGGGHHGRCSHGKGHHHGRGKRHERCGEDIKSLPLEERLAIKLSRCGFKIMHNHGGFHGKGRILKILAEKETITQAELLEIIDIKSGSLSEILSKMEVQGLISKVKDENDKRKINISITEIGKSTIENKKREHCNRDKEILKVLSEEEKNTLEELLDKVLHSINEIDK